MNLSDLVLGHHPYEFVGRFLMVLGTRWEERGNTSYIRLLSYRSFVAASKDDLF